MQCVVLFSAKPAFVTGRKDLKIRLVASAWCLASFILGTYYSADLISYITVPTITPLIKSIRDLPERPDVHLVIDKGINLDAILSVINY